MTADIQKIKRHFIPDDFILSNWDGIQPYFDELAKRPITSIETLEQWLLDISEIQAVVSEDACWRQIKMTCDTSNPALEEAFTFFCLEIEPHIKPYADLFNKKLINSEFLDALDHEKYFTYLRSVKKDIQLYRETNNALMAEVNVLAQQYGAISGKMSIEYNNQELTLQQAATYLMSPDRKIREEVYHAVNKRRLQDKTALNDLMDQLLAKRHQIARNAGFENYRDYKFVELGRFDYTVADCEHFHAAIEQYITPLVEKIYAHKQEKLGLDILKPYDIDAEPIGQQPLKPFQNGDELLNKSIEVFTSLDPFFGDCLRTMKRMGHVDLDSRKGKAPGGYNCPLAETGAPFIFMNAAGTADDVVTMMHEGGHAIHSFLSHDLPLSSFKEYPMEMAELASMSMELFSMDYWHIFYPNADELKRAKLEELERALSIFPWIATIDLFQHWLYTHPEHSNTERTEAWQRIHARFAPRNIDWHGLTSYRDILWQKQLHIFEVPFYYIEYGIAQLGALAMWQQYKQQPEKTLQQYKMALSKGNMLPLPALYETAGITFNFSATHIAQLANFVQSEMQLLMA